MDIYNFSIPEVKNLIEKIKRQDLMFGEYLESNLIFNKENGEIIYIGRTIDKIPHPPLILREGNSLT